MACTICNGSRYLAGDKALGRCICVTPEGMLALDAVIKQADAEMLVDILEIVGLVDDAGLLDRVTDYVEAVNETYSAITAGRLKTGDPKGLKDAVDQALDAVYDGAAVALSDYLVSIGLPAAPAGTTGNPALDSLIATIH